jgi:hypothetical protein
MQLRYGRLFQALVVGHNSPLKNPLFHLDWVYKQLLFFIDMCNIMQIMSQMVKEAPSWWRLGKSYIGYVEYAKKFIKSSFWVSK